MQVIFKEFRDILNYVISCAIFICGLSFLNGADSSNLKKDLIKVEEEEILRAQFGSGSDQIGALTPSEANPEGPMSFALGKDEEIYILDQINSRIQVFKDGKRINSIRLKKDIRYKDIALTPDNKIILLESSFETGYEKTSIHILDSNGKTINVIRLEDGSLLPNSGEVRGIQIVNEGKFSGIWADLCERSVRVASLKGESVQRWGLPGKLSLNGRRVFYAKRLGDITAVIYLSEKDSLSRWEPEIMVYFENFLDQFLGIWVDQKERIYFGVLLEKDKSLIPIMVIFSPEGKELGRLKLFVQKMPHEIWQSIRVSPEGNIFQMGLDEKGVFIRKYTLKK